VRLLCPQAYASHALVFPSDKTLALRTKYANPLIAHAATVDLIPLPELNVEVTLPGTMYWMKLTPAGCVCFLNLFLFLQLLSVSSDVLYDYTITHHLYRGFHQCQIPPFCLTRYELAKENAAKQRHFYCATNWESGTVAKTIPIPEAKPIPIPEAKPIPIRPTFGPIPMAPSHQQGRRRCFLNALSHSFPTICLAWSMITPLYITPTATFTTVYGPSV